MEHDHEESEDESGPPPGQAVEIYFLREAVHSLESTFNIPSLPSVDYETLLAAADKAASILIQAEAQAFRRLNEEIEESYRAAHR